MISYMQELKKSLSLNKMPSVTFRLRSIHSLRVYIKCNARITYYIGVQRMLKLCSFNSF